MFRRFGSLRSWNDRLLTKDVVYSSGVVSLRQHPPIWRNQKARLYQGSRWFSSKDGIDSKSPQVSQERGKITPMMKQYLSIKEDPQYKDHIVLFQMGDFLELFFDDAVKASKILNIALTKRGMHRNEAIPMAGVPLHARDAYIRRLVRAGEKVVCAEQTEAVDEAKRRGPSSIVKREVTEIVTPGTLIESHQLQPAEHNYLASIWKSPDVNSDTGDESVAICWVELSTGEFYSMRSSTSTLTDDLGIFTPAELLVPNSLMETDDEEHPLRQQLYSLFRERALGLEDVALTLIDNNQDSSRNKLLSASGTRDIGYIDLDYLETSEMEPAEAGAIFLALRYASWTQRDTLPKLKPLKRITEYDKSMDAMKTKNTLNRSTNRWRTLQMDATTRRALEIYYPSHGKGRGKGSLINCIDKCSHAAGSRALMTRLTVPCADANIVRGRHAAVGWLAERHNLRRRIRSLLSGEANGDVQRALQRVCITSRKSTAEDLLLIRDAMTALQRIGYMIVYEDAMCSVSTAELEAAAKYLWKGCEFNDRMLLKQSSCEFDDTCILESFLTPNQYENMISQDALNTPGIRHLVLGLLVPLKADGNQLMTNLAKVHSHLSDALVNESEETESPSTGDSPPKRTTNFERYRNSFIRKGFDQELDKLIELRDDSKAVVGQLQEKYRREIGIPSLRVKHTSEQGYTVEVSNRYAETVSQWNEKNCQDRSKTLIWAKTLKNAIRYKNEELSELDRKIADASARSAAIEERVIQELASKVQATAEQLHAVATAAAVLDVHCAFAEIAISMNLKPPIVYDETDTDTQSTGCLYLGSSRHLVVERSLREGWQYKDEEVTGNPGGRSFVANDVSMPDHLSTNLDNDLRMSSLNYNEDVHGYLSRTWLITGPNMGGKSTFLRQVAHCTILAQCGSFVPASSAAIGIVDRIFARVGSNDDLARDRSTFMVEMQETSALCKYATPRSLVLVDEVGRGTATADGIAIAWAVLEYLVNTVQCRTLYATHFHELASLVEGIYGGTKHRADQVKYRDIECHQVTAEETSQGPVLTHKIRPGRAQYSHGLYVAKSAGLPEPILARARELLDVIDDHKGRQTSFVDEYSKVVSPNRTT